MITAAAICIALTLWSALWFWSAVLTVRPEAVLTQWQENSNDNAKAEVKAENLKEEYNQALALKMIARLEQSIAINSLDANSHLLMASYYEILANNTPSEYEKFTKLAATSYQQATHHQPSWDYAWAKQARFYSNRLPINQTAVEHALSKAMLFGPYEQKNQEILIPLIFKHWSLLFENKKNHNQAIKIIRHALKFYKHAHLTLDSAKKYQRLIEIEPLLTQQWHKNRLKKYLREAVYD